MAAACLHREHFLRRAYVLLMGDVSALHTRNLQGNVIQDITDDPIQDMSIEVVTSSLVSNLLYSGRGRQRHSRGSSHINPLRHNSACMPVLEKSSSSL